MNATRDPERILASWLDEGPTDLPDATRRAILTSLPTTAQLGRGPFAPRRFPGMNGLARLAAMAVVAVVAVAGAIFALRLPPGPGGPSPSPVSTPASTTLPPTTAPSATTGGPSIAITPPPMPTFTSTQFGYTIGHPTVWLPSQPATEAWALGAPIGPVEAWVDRFSGPSAGGGGVAFIGIAAQPIPDGLTAEEWMLDYAIRLEDSDRPCLAPASAWTDRTVGDVAARQVDGPCDPAIAGTAGPFRDVVWVVDDTGYAITGNPNIIDLMVETFQPPQ